MSAEEKFSVVNEIVNEYENGHEHKPLHQMICDYVRELILSGEYHHQKLPTDSQLMRRFSVSRGTVVKAMRDLEIGGMIERRKGKGSFPRSASIAAPPLFAIVIAAPGDMEFYNPFCSTIAGECYRNNYGLLWGGTPGPEPHELTRQLSQEWGRRLLAQKVSGVFFVPGELPDGCGHNPNLLFLEEMTRHGLKVVLLDRDYVDYPQEGIYDTISVNNFHAGFTQTEHLIEQGCRRIVYLSRPGMLSTKSARIAGYLYALKKAKLDIMPVPVLRDSVHSPSLMKRLEELKPDGIVCFCDPIAADLICVLLDHGIEIPRQIKIIGIDDVNYSRLIQVPLTSLRQPCAEIGRLALKLMTDRIADETLPPRHLQLAAQLVVRESTVES